MPTFNVYFKWWPDQSSSLLSVYAQ